ncbi:MULTISPECIES: diguanylate cyclase [Paraburkholderia]|uniref:diguanylate cyclase n=1 Tax=Paraburkholderia TaxID=1822464 RepID=UPI00225751C4|nr:MULTISPECIES: diguanylate cyclase [Paraburkholderia]MCX4164850.1 diguanylate cyclase [Paraburkholderia megapolitana]MDN7160343.1 diguanylate cyclase [Paraburkholderia sp. CHISQ3]MDQ6497390.1 diguanylate cyclase [Paraburkholderia megapolitana]
MEYAAKKGKRFVQRIYRLRTAGLALGFISIAPVFLQLHHGPLLWALLLLYGFVWPHLARYAALAGAVPYRSEQRNLMVDAVFGGFWLVAIRFNLLPGVLMLSMLSMNNIASGGLRLFLRGVVANLAGAAIGVATLGFVLAPQSQMHIVIACLPVLVLYPLALGWSVYRMSRKLAAQTRTLEHLSRTDGLTGLLNRRYWEERLAAEFERCNAQHLTSCLLLIDLDHFKQINDSRGHLAGDTVLQSFADMLRDEFRHSDSIGRYGGEEFGVVLPDASLTEARAIATRLLHAVREKTNQEHAVSPFTISIGIAPCPPDGSDYHAWLLEADRSLYRAKVLGRDQIAVAGELEPASGTPIDPPSVHSNIKKG